MEDSFADALRGYHKAGWRVIPVVVYDSVDKNGQPKRSKSPLVDWTQYKGGARDETIEKWCADPFMQKYAGIALITGRYTANLSVCGVDFDQKDGKPDFMPYVEDLTDAARTRTSSGGYHYIFSTQDLLKNAQNIFGGDKEGKDTIVDFRGEAGLMVLGPTPRWSRDPRTGGDDLKIMGRYETSCMTNVEALGPLPPRFTVAMNTRNIVGEKAYAKIFTEDVKEGGRHDVAKSLIAKLLVGVTSAEEVRGARELVYSIIKLRFKGDIDQKEIDDIFEWVVAQEKKRRSPEYETMKRHIKAAEEKDNLSKWSGLLRPIKAEVRGDIINYYDPEGRTMRTQVDKYYNQESFRRAHKLAYDTPLPIISKKKFEDIVNAIPVTTVRGEAISVDDLIMETLEKWTHEAEPFDDADAAMSLAIRKGRGVSSGKDNIRTLYFTYKVLQNTLIEENIKSSRGEVFTILDGLKVKLTRYKSTYLHRYVSRMEK